MKLIGVGQGKQRSQTNKSSTLFHYGYLSCQNDYNCSIKINNVYSLKNKIKIKILGSNQFREF